jgi:alpha,alpha-trehalose phosphorylase
MVDIEHERARYSLRAGDPIEITHHGQRVTLQRDEPVDLEIPPAPERTRPSQPPGREPARRPVRR